MALSWRAAVGTLKHCSGRPHRLGYSESGVRPNTLVRFDTRTETFQTWVIPSGGGVVRHMMAMSDSNLMLACSGLNRVALVDVND
jgi:virginiamycin B lyase